MTVITAHSNPQSSNLLRILTAGILAVSVTFGLFFLMQMLLATDFVKPVKTQTTTIKLAHIRDTEPVKEKITPPERPVTQNTLEETTPVIENTEGPGIPTIDTPPAPPIIDTRLKGIIAPDGEMQILTPFAPPYPNSLLTRGIEGYVIVRFDVTKIGNVVKASAIESSHKGFENTSLKTIKRFKYKPRIKDGEPQYAANILYRFTFSIKK
jgi:protein TonB